MTDKLPAQLVIAINSGQGGWFATAIEPSAEPAPLIRAGQGYIAGYADDVFDEQVSFLRHRLAGILQLACDRMWARKLKPSHMVLLVDSHFEGDVQLTQAVADHFVEWMTSPAVTFYICERLFDDNPDKHFELLAGQENDESREQLGCGSTQFPVLFSNHELWEIAPPKK